MGIRETAKELKDAVVPEGYDGWGAPKQREGESDEAFARREREAGHSAAAASAASTSAAVVS